MSMNTKPLSIGWLYRALYREGSVTTPPRCLSRKQKDEKIHKLSTQNGCALSIVTYVRLGEEKSQPVNQAYKWFISPQPPYHNDLNDDQKLEAILALAAVKNVRVRLSTRYKIELRTED